MTIPVRQQMTIPMETFRRMVQDETGIVLAADAAVRVTRHKDQEPSLVIIWTPAEAAAKGRK
jgi:hypothetical protein